MAIKKITLLAFTLLSLKDAVFAQTDWGWDWKDSSKVAVKDKPQFNQFLNNQFPYPAKPNSQAELAFGLGYASVIGDLNSGLGGVLSVSYRKALGHNFSYRYNFSTSIATGKPSDYQASATIGAKKYTNYAQSLGADLVFAINPASYYRGNPKTSFYAFAGMSIQGVSVTKDGKSFRGYNNFLYSGDGLITEGFNKTSFVVSAPALNGGVGVAFKINDKINLGLEQRFIYTQNDFFDGSNGTPDNASAAGAVPRTSSQILKIRDRDYFSFTSVKLNINIGDASKKVQPLWWINPNNFVYSELNTPKHMKLPKVVLPDADKDGVTDQFDLQPNTPAGAPVDSHGVAKDTDGDGVLDYKDKEPLTSQKCFPVNNDGIGTCPESACCKEIKDLLASGAFVKQGDKKEVLTNLPTIQFKNKANSLTKQDEELLSSIAKKLNENPDAKIKLIGYGASSKAAQQLSWERVNAIKKHLVEKLGISENRIIFTYGLEGDANTVDIQGTTEEGPSTVPAPHPNLKGAAKATSKKR